MSSAFAPGSWPTLVLLLLAFLGCAVGLSRARPVLLRLLAGTGALLTATVLGISLVNTYYSYYSSWGVLFADLREDNGAAASPAQIPVRRPGLPAPAVASAPAGRGRLVSLAMPGTVSGVRGRRALVWLPPQYDDPRFATVRFPVLELLHGDPGEPSSWTNGLDLPDVLNQEYARGTSAPMVVVMPDVTGGFRLQQCLDAVRGPRLDTYLTADIPRDLAARIRIDPPGPAWAVGGLSEGGFCAARLALRHRSDFGAAAVMDGYFHLQLTPSVRRALYGAAAAPARDDPTALLAALPAGPPVPAFWLMAGTGNAHDYREAITFATALGRREDLRFLTVIGGRHTTPAWQAAFPDLLRWAAATVHGHPTYGQSSRHV